VVPIGRPVANLQAYILDEQCQPVPIGVPGQLYLGGAGLGRGYLNRPDLTAQRFIPHPFSPDPGARLYQTGDLARYLADGNIEFLGRADFQIKIRGQRLEPGEIEAALASLEAIDRAIVVALHDLPAGERLAAYLVPAVGSASPPTGKDLRAYLATKLPEYMIPSVFVYLEELPLLPNGKVDRNSLPAPDSTRLEGQAEYIPPGSDAERIIAGVWEAALGISPIGVQENFFEIGGNSLSATRLITQLQNIFQVKIPLNRFFQANSIIQCAALVEELLIEQIENLDEEQAQTLLSPNSPDRPLTTG
jgi:acyl carrier protein